MSPLVIYYRDMLRTVALISSLTEVPRQWVFENYLKINEQLTGQDVMILSPFNVKDKRPSFSIYVEKRSLLYRFKDFSTGLGGDAVELVKELFHLTTRGEAAHKIVSDYNQWLLTNKANNGIREFKVQSKYKVSEHTKRLWNNFDQKYWTKFHIGSKLLEKFNVYPLESYKMTKDIDGYEYQMVIEGRDNMYGFFRVDGTLYKIYQPLVKDSKFIKVRDYIQGTDQLTYKTKYLVICSSLKDVMAFTRLGYKEAEAVAPDSENTLIPEHVMNSYKIKYSQICTLFDNDEPGIKAMKTYKDKYGIKDALLPLSKDLSDSIRDHGIQVIKETLTPILKEALS